MAIANCRLAFCIIGFFILTGCATKNITKEYEFNDKSSSGLIIGSLTQDKKSGAHRANSTFIINTVPKELPKRILKTREDVFLNLFGYRASELDNLNGRIFVVELPEGVYELESWVVENGTGARIYPRNDPPAIKFDVKAGEIVYVGNLHMHLSTGENFLGIDITDEAVPEISNKSERDIMLFKENYPKLSKNKIYIRPFKQGMWITGHDIKSVKEINIPPVINPK